MTETMKEDIYIVDCKICFNYRSLNKHDYINHMKENHPDKHLCEYCLKHFSFKKQLINHLENDCKFLKKDNKPVIKKPVIVEPIIVEPVKKKIPALIEPVIKKPVIVEPVIKKPVIVEPVIKKPVKKKPAIVEPVKKKIPALIRCHVCFKRFNTDKIIDHIKKCEKERKKCPYCDKYIIHINVHIKEKHPEHFKGIKCPICNKKFINKQGVKRHLSSEHNELYREFVKWRKEELRKLNSYDYFKKKGREGMTG